MERLLQCEFCGSTMQMIYQKENQVYYECIECGNGIWLEYECIECSSGIWAEKINDNYIN